MLCGKRWSKIGCFLYIKRKKDKGVDEERLPLHNNQILISRKIKLERTKSSTLNVN